MTGRNAHDKVHDIYLDPKEAARACGCPSCRAKYNLPKEGPSKSVILGNIVGLTVLAAGAYAISKLVKV